MDFLPTYIVSAFSFVIILVILWLWHLDRKDQAVERKDLYDRLMSKNLIEYKAESTPEPNQVDEVDPNLVDLTDETAKAQLMGEEVEEEEDEG